MSPFMTKIVRTDDQEAGSMEFQRAKEKETNGPQSHGVFEPVLFEDVPGGSKILGGRFDLPLKGVGNAKEKTKSCYIVRGFKDSERDFVLHSVAVVQQR